jgi:hypothetical protein
MRRLIQSALIALALTAGAMAETAPVRLRRVSAWPSSSAPLSLSELQVKIDGKATRALRAHGPKDDLLLLIVLDLTEDLSLIDPARTALAQELGRLPSNAWVGVLQAQDGLHVLSDPSPDVQKSIQAIQTASTTGSAGLLGALEPAAQLSDGIMEKSPVRIAVLFVTDSNIHNYREDYTNPVINSSDTRDLSRKFPDALIREKTTRLSSALAAYDSPIFVVHLAYMRDQLNTAYQTGLQQMAQSTGGSAIFCRSPADIPVEISAAIARITTHWAVDFEVPKDTPRRFTVEMAGKDLQLDYRSRFANRPKTKEAAVR